MEKLQWQESYSVNNEVIDSQHKKLIQMISKMLGSRETRVDSEIISEMLTGLTEYASMHFDTEESCMEKADYPDLKAHKEEHRQFKLKVGQFCVEVMAHNQSVPQEMLQFLSEWLVHHILHVDMQYKPFL